MTRAAEQAANTPAARLALAELLLNDGRYEEAHRRFEEVLADDGSPAVADRANDYATVCDSRESSAPPFAFGSAAISRTCARSNFRSS